jgi:hypothetical protein
LVPEHEVIEVYLLIQEATILKIVLMKLNADKSLGHLRQ